MFRFRIACLTVLWEAEFKWEPELKGKKEINEEIKIEDVSIYNQVVYRQEAFLTTEKIRKEFLSTMLKLNHDVNILEWEIFT